MHCNLHNVIDDVQRLSNRIRDRELLADELCQKIHSVQAQLMSMRQYQEEILSFHDLARKLGNRPNAPLILCLAAEDKQIQQLKIENHALFNSLEEHQTVLDLIMTKYREQVTQLLHANQVESMVHSGAQSPAGTRTPNPTANKAGPPASLPGVKQAAAVAVTRGAGSTAAVSDEKRVDLATQVAALATFARDVSDKSEAYTSELELELHRLRTENAGLRELLDISGNFSALDHGLAPSTPTVKSPFDSNNTSGGTKPLCPRSGGVVFGSNQHCNAKTGLPIPPAPANQHTFLSSLDIKKHREDADPKDSVHGLLRSFAQLEGKISQTQKEEDNFQYNVDDEDTLTVTDDLVDDMLDGEPYIRSFPSLG